MELTGRQQEILNLLIEEYIRKAEPISSNFLQEKWGVDISPATIRNEFQELTEKGFIAQPHTSAGRVPTNKAYRYFIEQETLRDEKRFEDFISREVEKTKKKIEKEMELAEELIESLKEISLTLNFTRIKDRDGILEILEIMGPSRATYQKNINLMKDLIKELESF